MKDDWPGRWLVDWSLWYSQWIDRSAIGYPSSTAEYRVANGPGRSGIPGTIVPKIDKPRHICIVDRIIVDSDQVTKQAIYWKYQFYIPLVKLKEEHRIALFRIMTGKSARTYCYRIAAVKVRIRRKT